MSDWWNSIGSDWNAPFRGQPQPTSPSGSIRIGGGGGPGIPVNDPTGVLSRTPGATLNTTGPEIYPPNNRPINPTRQVGPFTGGVSTDAQMAGDSAGGGGAGGGGGRASSWWHDPSSWSWGGQGSNWLSGLGGLLNLGPATIPAITGATMAAGYKYGDPALQKMSVDPRLDAAGSGGFDVTQPLGQSPQTQQQTQQPFYDPTVGSGGISPAPNPYGAGMPRGTQLPPNAPPPVTRAPATPPPRPRTVGGGGRVRPAAPQAIGIGHYIPTTGVGRSGGSYVTPQGAVIAPGPLSMFR